MWNCPQMNVVEPLWWKVNNISGNGFMPSGNKPLPEPMLTQIYVVITWANDDSNLRCHMASPATMRWSYMMYTYWKLVYLLEDWPLMCRELSYLSLTRSISWLLMPWLLTSPGVGVTKAPFVSFSVNKIFDLAKVPFRLSKSHLYLTGATTAELRRHLSNINVIFKS